MELELHLFPAFLSMCRMELLSPPFSFFPLNMWDRVACPIFLHADESEEAIVALGAVFVVVSVESVMDMHRLVIDVTLPREHQPSDAIQSGLWAASDNRLLSSPRIDPVAQCVDDGVKVGVVDSGDDPLLVVSDADVSRSWTERGGRWRV
jgi:hypothetical protein